MNLRSLRISVAALLFVGGTAFAPRGSSLRPSFVLRSSDSETTSSVNAATSSTSESDNPYGLTPELLKVANAFESIGDDKLRYKQLLYMANQLDPIDPASQTPENKVPGCLSTVFVDGKAEEDPESAGTYLIHFTGDSDGLLTKGLVALLIRGLSGNSAAAIQKVDPAFIQKAGISASLTPGRNNGFLNMLASMKKKALQLEEAAKSGASSGEKDTVAPAPIGDDGDKPMYNGMMEALKMLKPEFLKLEDVSYKHAGHAGSKGFNGESHFELEIVAEAFEGLNLVKRHKLIYMLLGDIMPKIHALQITAKTPEEANRS